MFAKTEQRLRQLSDSAFSGLLFAIIVIRVGPSPIGESWVRSVYDAARVFPKSDTYFSFSIFPMLLAKTLGEPRLVVWWGFFGALLIFWFFAVMRRLRVLFPNHYRIVQIIFAASQVVMLEITHVGHYDNISVIAASLVFLWDVPVLIYVGALLAASGNPNMSFATGICVLFLYLGTRDKKHLRIGIVWTSISAIALIALHFWMNGPASNTRENIVINEVGYVVKGSLGVWAFIFLSVLGPLWILFTWLISQKEWSFGSVTTLRKALAAIGIVGIPTVMSFFILDHTRIGVVTGALPLFLYLLPELKFRFSQLDPLRKFTFPVTSTMLLVWIIYPAIIVDSSALFRLPYASFVSLVSGN
jgi:hypothetical protein